MKTRILSSLLALLLLLSAVSLISCGAVAGDEEPRPADPYTSQTDASKVLMDTGSVDATEDGATKRMIIHRATVDAETLTFNDTVAALEKCVEESDGFIESSRRDNRSIGDNASLRYANFVLRVPENSYGDFLKKLEGLLNITSLTENTDDVTLSYTDLEGRIKAYRAEESSLLAMLEKAENLSDTMEIQKRLTELRYQIESDQSQLNKLKDLVTYCTVNVELREVEALTETEEFTSVWDEIGSRFSENFDVVMNGLRYFFVWLIGSMPILLLLAAIAGIVLLIIFLVRRYRRKHPQKPYKVAIHSSDLSEQDRP